MTTRPSALTVRDAGPADREFVTDLLTASGLPLDGIDDVDRLLIAQADDRPIAVAALERHGSDDDIVYLLRSVAVRSADRGTGAGSAVVKAALRIVDDAHAPVALLTETAAGYFPRFGFRPVSRTDLPAVLASSPELQGACPETAIALLRTATP